MFTLIQFTLGGALFFIAMAFFVGGLMFYLIKDYLKKQPVSISVFVESNINYQYEYIIKRIQSAENRKKLRSVEQSLLKHFLHKFHDDPEVSDLEMNLKEAVKIKETDFIINKALKQSVV